MSAHANCKHSANRQHRAVCRKIAAQVAEFTALTSEELSAAMRAGTQVTGWTVYSHESIPGGSVKREITGTLDYVETNSEGVKIWTIRFVIDPTGKTCNAALESAGTFPTGRIRLAA